MMITIREIKASPETVEKFIKFCREEDKDYEDFVESEVALNPYLTCHRCGHYYGSHIKQYPTSIVECIADGDDTYCFCNEFEVE